jgi:hypothetical protein
MPINNSEFDHLRKFYLFEERPVKFVFTPTGEKYVLKFDRVTGIFDYGMEYNSKITHNRDYDIEQLSYDDFIQYVESLRAKIVKEDGELLSIYKKINTIEDTAKQEGRTLTKEETETLLDLKKKSYQMFSDKYEKDLDWYGLG